MNAAAKSPELTATAYRSRYQGNTARTLGGWDVSISAIGTVLAGLPRPWAETCETHRAKQIKTARAGIAI